MGLPEIVGDGVVEQEVKKPKDLKKAAERESEKRPEQESAPAAPVPQMSQANVAAATAMMRDAELSVMDAGRSEYWAYCARIEA